MPPKSQKQKQKQTVIVNIGDKIVRRRRRKRVGKAKPRPPDAGQAPRPQFVQTLYPVVNPIQSEQLQFNLSNINKQLQTLQDKQLNATANLMSGRAAIQRAESEQAQVPGLGTPEAEFFDPLPEQPAQPTRGRDPVQKKRLVRADPPELAPPKPPPSPVAPPASSPSPLAERSGSKPRKPRSDKGTARGPLLRTASKEAIARGSRIAFLAPGYTSAAPNPFGIDEEQFLTAKTQKRP